MQSQRVRVRGAATGEANGTRQWQRLKQWISGVDQKLLGQIKTFFFYNFLENWVQNDNQMVRRLNDIWFGSFKLRVKIAEERSNGRVKEADTGGRKQYRVDRMVQPGQTYAQAVKGKEQKPQHMLICGRKMEREKRDNTHRKKTPSQARQQKWKEEVASCDTMNNKKRMVEKSGLEIQEEIMEFIPEQSELQWLEGGMVAIVKSLTMINEIQQRIDVDGGLITLAPLGGRRVLLTEKEPGFLLEFMKLNQEVLALWFEDIQSWDKEVQERSRMVWLRISGIPLKAWSDRCFKMIGESVGEVIKIHEDTKMKSILCDGRMLVICSVDHKISKRFTLKMEEKLYEIRVDEEEWRSDPDWWLSDDERRDESLTESDQSLEQSSEHSLEQIDEEDQDWINFEICDEEDVSIDEEHLMMDGQGNSNSKFKKTEEKRESRQTEEGNDGREDVCSGPTKDIGPKITKEIGLGEIGLKDAIGQGRDLSHGHTTGIKKKGPNETNEEGIFPKPDLDLRVLGNKRRRKLEECYPKNLAKSRTKKMQETNARATQRHKGRAESSTGLANNVNLVSSCSISDGCIANRNRELRREMILHEVRKMLSIGKRLGFQTQENEGEIQSRLVELQEREEAGERQGKRRKEIGNLVQRERPDFLFLQKTKLERMDDELSRIVWNSRECGWVMKESIGASGGLMCFWNKKNFAKTRDYTGDGYLRITGEWGIHKAKCNLVNVYGPNDRQKRLKLWDELRNMITEEGGRWLITGDFNAVRCLEERRGRSGESPDMREFDVFILSAGLIDIKMVNRRFTWYKPDGTAMSRLDRVLMNAEMCRMGGDWVQQGLKRNISDHCAIVLKSRTTDWGPKPFRVLDAWLLHPDFKKIIKEKWKSMERQEGFQKMWDIMRKREVIWKQKSRSNWVRVGDANTRFFHRVANGRKAQNQITSLMCDGSWVEEPTQRKINGLNDHSPPKKLRKRYEVVKARKLWAQTAKVLANRLKSVLPGIISENQSAFLGGRQLVDGVLVLNEVVEEVKRKKQQAFVFKADFAKAYDCLMAAPQRSSRSKKDYDKVIRYLRFYLDDWRGVKWIGAKSSDRGAVPSKSSIYRYNVLVRWVEGSAGMLRCGVGKSPFIYLGMPVDGNTGRKKVWEPLINKFRAKLVVWKAASLSFGGRLTLLNSVLSALPIFYMSLFLIPNSVLVELISIQRTFLWGGVESQKKISWVKWDYVCCSKQKGGLGVSDLRRKNWALLGKWWFRFGDGVESLWKRIVKEKYYGGKWEEVDITAFGNRRMSKLWRDIINIGGRSMKLSNILVEGFKWEVGEGNRVSFWSNPWVGNKTLRVEYPRLYELSTNKECKISDIGVWEGDKWCWKMEWRRERIGREKDEEEKLREGLERIQLKKSVQDCWRWIHDSEGRYGVKNAYDFLAPTECVLDEHWSKLIWCKLVPSKVSFFGWRLCLDRLPTKWNIRKRGVPLQEEELKCVLCKDKVEEINHLFNMCKEVWIFWVEVMQWWGMVTVMPNNVLSVADIFVNDLGRLIGKEMGACIFLVAAWYLWYWRNGEVFQNGNNIRGRLMDMVQAKSFFWIKTKIHGCVFSFHEWKVKPVECDLSVRKYKQMQKLFHKQQKGMGKA
ncbi:hypothetical protein SLEP1_g27551 [Rubroshorea leprosula]|uniref:Reverse transcriptase domain-containing protein n=1 Tax=Rubroshorea leprosula TaxID=152421 RepID=A0AAV5K1K0_9ROSI|nr:hypothetical protein SLEP1_g27551 [Rubroshorea leprosula]